MALITTAVRDTGARIVAWQEAAQHLGEGDLVQVWDPRLAAEPVIAAAERGAQVILSPASRVYLDMKYTEDSERGLVWMGHTELADTAGFVPHTMIEGLNPERIIGVEAALWTETLETFDHLSYMLLPRLAAVGEIGKRGELDWDDFASRLPGMAEQWEANGWPYHRSPGVAWPS